MSDQCCKCGWIGTDDDKVVPETQKHQFLKDLACPECGNDDFYSPPIKPTARMKRYQQNAELKKIRAELSEAQLQARQWHDAFDRTMADYHTVTEQVAELRAAADLLNEIADHFGIGEAARTRSTILTNIDNAIRRSECLSRIEAFHTIIEADEDGEQDESSLLNWADDPDQYLHRYKSIVAQSDTADLLARVRSECDVYYDTPSHIKGVVIMCRDEAFLRELAEALKHYSKT